MENKMQSETEKKMMQSPLYRHYRAIGFTQVKALMMLKRIDDALFQQTGQQKESGDVMKSEISIRFVYPFKELSKEARAHAIEKYYEHEDFPFLNEELLQEANCIAPYWEDVRLNYSLGYSQGDGLSFSGTLNLKEFLATKMPQVHRPAILCEYIYKVHSKGNTGRYSYGSASDVDIDFNYTSGKEHKRLDKLAYSILEAVQVDYIHTCKALEKTGYATLEYRMSEDEFQEHSEANEYQYSEEGNLV